MENKIEMIDAFKSNTIQDCISYKPILSSYKHSWSNINLILTCTPPIEVPDHYCLQHVITAITRQTESEICENGKMKPMHYHAGEIVFHPAMMTRIIHHRSVAEAISVIVDPAYVSNMDPDSINPDTVELLSNNQIEDPLLYQLCVALKSEVATGSPAKLYVDSLANSLSAHLLHKYSSREYVLHNYKGGLEPKKLKMVIDYINDNISKEITLIMLSELTGISRYHFGRLFKQSTGITPHKYILQQRINQAKILLLQNKKSISEIALDCGFAHQSHFYRHFKRLIGTTPKKFKENLSN